MKKITFKPIMLVIGALSLVVVGCKKYDVHPTDDHEHNESELITTLELKFSGKGKVNKDTTFVVTFDDPDGDGGNSPTKFDQINLLKNTDYTVELLLLNKTNMYCRADFVVFILLQDKFSFLVFILLTKLHKSRK